MAAQLLEDVQSRDTDPDVWRRMEVGSGSRRSFQVSLFTLHTFVITLATPSSSRCQVTDTSS